MIHPPLEVEVVVGHGNVHAVLIVVLPVKSFFWVVYMGCSLYFPNRLMPWIFRRRGEEKED